MASMGPCYIVRRGKVTHLQNLTSRAFAAALLIAAASAAAAQNLPVRVGQSYEEAVAALKAKGIRYEEDAADAGRKITYTSAGESVSLEFAWWPKDPNAPASAWDASASSGNHLVLTHIQDVAPGSDARRAWVRTYEKDGKRWGYLSDKALADRPAAERAKYPVAAYLQWPASSGAAPVTFLFQAARAAGAPPGTETTQLDVFLENPHRPRRF